MSDIGPHARLRADAMGLHGGPTAASTSNTIANTNVAGTIVPVAADSVMVSVVVASADRGRPARGTPADARSHPALWLVFYGSESRQGRGERAISDSGTGCSAEFALAEIIGPDFIAKGF